jgi:hypothetical protein
MQNVRRWCWTLAFFALTVAVVILAKNLDLDGFFVGDCGVKYIAARNAIAHPMRPFEIGLPRVGTASAAEFMEPFWSRHGNHAHPSTPPIFPLITAPLIAAFGLPGAYVLPLVSFLLLIPSTVMLRRNSGTCGTDGAAAAAIAALSPMLFYGLEYWEHSTAVLLGTLSAGLALTSGAPRVALVMAGALAGGAFLLRPEALWSVIAVAVVVLVLGTRASRVALFLLSAVLIVLPLGVYNCVHFGDPWGIHMRNNFVSFDAEWLSARSAIVRAWLLNWGTRDSLWRVFPLATLAVMFPRVRGRASLLWFLVLVPLAGAVVMAPNTGGGGQWGPRYALMIVPPLLLLSIDSAARFLKRFRNRWLSSIAILAVVASVVSGLMATRASYRELRGSKKMSAEVARAVAATDCDYVVTNVWWLDQLSAANSRSQIFLYVDSVEKAGEALGLLRAQGVSRTVFVRSAEGPAWGVDGGTQGYRIAEVRHVRPRGLDLAMLVRE